MIDYSAGLSFIGILNELPSTATNGDFAIVDDTVYVYTTPYKWQKICNVKDEDVFNGTYIIDENLLLDIK